MVLGGSLFADALLLLAISFSLPAMIAACSSSSLSSCTNCRQCFDAGGKWTSPSGIDSPFSGTCISISASCSGQTWTYGCDCSTGSSRLCTNSCSQGGALSLCSSCQSCFDAGGVWSSESDSAFTGFCRNTPSCPCISNNWIFANRRCSTIESKLCSSCSSSLSSCNSCAVCSANGGRWTSSSNDPFSTSSGSCSSSSSTCSGGRRFQSDCVNSVDCFSSGFSSRSVDEAVTGLIVGLVVFFLLWIVNMIAVGVFSRRKGLNPLPYVALAFFCGVFAWIGVAISQPDTTVVVVTDGTQMQGYPPAQMQTYPPAQMQAYPPAQMQTYPPAQMHGYPPAQMQGYPPGPYGSSDPNPYGNAAPNPYANAPNPYGNAAPIPYGVAPQNYDGNAAPNASGNPHPTPPAAGPVPHSDSTPFLP